MKSTAVPNTVPGSLQSHVSGFVGSPASVTLGSLLVSLKGTCPLGVPGPWRIGCVLIGDRSPKCFKVVSLKAGQVRQFTCARMKTEVGYVSMIVRDISLSVAARL